jgi:hypothetical protein
MAIVVEEENSRASVGWGGLVIWGIVFVILAISVYYIFFKRPDLVEGHTPANFEDTVQLSKVNLNPDQVVRNPLFTSFRVAAPPLQTTPSSRSNPFLGTF